MYVVIIFHFILFILLDKCVNAFKIEKKDDIYFNKEDNNSISINEIVILFRDVNKKFKDVIAFKKGKNDANIQKEWKKNQNNKDTIEINVEELFQELNHHHDKNNNNNNNVKKNEKLDNNDNNDNDDEKSYPKNDIFVKKSKKRYSGDGNNDNRNNNMNNIKKINTNPSIISNIKNVTKEKNAKKESNMKKYISDNNNNNNNSNTGNILVETHEEKIIRILKRLVLKNTKNFENDGNDTVNEKEDDNNDSTILRKKINHFKYAVRDILNEQHIQDEKKNWICNRLDYYLNKMLLH